MVELEPEDVRRPAEAGARLVALRQLDEARAACERLPDAGDAEAIHDLRVALRRLRSTLIAYHGFLDPDATSEALSGLGRLASRTGVARDAQVALTWLRTERAELRPARSRMLDPLVETLEARVAAQHAREIEGLGADFAHIERELRTSLETYRARVAPAGAARPASLASVASSALKTTAAELEAALARVTGPRTSASTRRIVATRLRYLLEPVRRISTRSGAARELEAPAGPDRRPPRPRRAQGPSSSRRSSRRRSPTASALAARFARGFQPSAACARRSEPAARAPGALAREPTRCSRSSRRPGSARRARIFARLADFSTALRG
jgi:CHAD domain-containing protein